MANSLSTSVLRSALAESTAPCAAFISSVKPSLISLRRPALWTAAIAVARCVSRSCRCARAWSLVVMASSTWSAAVAHLGQLGADHLSGILIDNTSDLPSGIIDDAAFDLIPEAVAFRFEIVGLSCNSGLDGLGIPAIVRNVLRGQAQIVPHCRIVGGQIGSDDPPPPSSLRRSSASRSTMPAGLAPPSRIAPDCAAPIAADGAASASGRLRDGDRAPASLPGRCCPPPFVAPALPLAVVPCIELERSAPSSGGSLPRH